MSRLRFFLFLTLLLGCVTPLLAAVSLLEPGAKSKCAVCGMFVTRHPDWSAALEVEGASPEFFCSPKDLLKFIHFPKRYLPEISRQHIKNIQVKDYYTLNAIDGRRAWYVTGSDVLGPMGHDLVPFLRREDAEGFLQDHIGRQIVTFEQITPPLLKELD
ncbi:MAG: nitrous oxide reductase accessory protein NosL [Deltaproteobacteria bacterium HGW-Deltaproteobacteria-4]|nr:MAG: nitrous oxide reductase accessory protein NosL [Deltaproteobacteria bacterium HGW-Deltaproteobacteria-4]